MKKLMRMLLLIGAALPNGPALYAQDLPRPDKPVLSQSLAENILWTRRADRFTLQILTSWRPVPAKDEVASKPSAAIRRELPDIHATLLRKGGEAIAAQQRWQTPAPKGAALVVRQPRAEVLFAYPLSAGEEAVAVVICTDGACEVRQIAPFPL